MSVWSWMHRHAIWREVNSTYACGSARSGYTRARYHTRLPLPSRAARWLAQTAADRTNRQVFVARVRQEPRYKGLHAWEVTYQ